MFYPNDVPTFRTVADRTGVSYDSTKTKVLFAKDINDLATTLTNVMNTLGLNPEGTVTTVGDRLDDIEAYLSDLGDYKFRAYVGTAQAVSSASEATVQFDSTNYDLNSDFDTTNYKYIVPVDGYYHFSATITMNSIVNEKYLSVRIKKNGTSIASKFIHSGSGDGLSLTVDTDDYFDEDDEITVTVYHNSGVSKNVFDNAGRSWFYGHKLN